MLSAPIDLPSEIAEYFKIYAAEEDDVVCCWQCNLIVARAFLTLSLSTSQLVQFFGTSEVSWLARKAVTPWEEGAKRNFAKKSKAKDFIAALSEVSAYQADPTAIPTGGKLAWWSDPLRTGFNPPKRAAAEAGASTKRPVGESSAGTSQALPPKKVKLAEVDASGLPPPNYVPLRKSEWVSRPAPKQLPKDEGQVCECVPPPPPADGSEPPRSGCGDDCLNRSTRFFCDSRTCPCGKSCGNRPFHLLRSPRTRRVATQGRGWGLVAAERIAAGTFVVEYIGEILDDASCEARLWSDKRSGETNFYMMEVSRNCVIDARFKGNVSRLINSSCDPNCETQRWVDSATGETRVGIFTMVDVEVDVELTYDYCFAHFDPDNAAAASFQCHCGAETCRGALDTNPLRAQNRGRRVRVQWDDGIFYSGTILHYSGTSNKYKADARPRPRVVDWLGLLLKHAQHSP